MVLSTTVTPESLDVIILYNKLTHKTLLFIIIISLDVSNALVGIYNTDECIKLLSDTYSNFKSALCSEN